MGVFRSCKNTSRSNETSEDCSLVDPHVLILLSGDVLWHKHLGHFCSTEDLQVFNTLTEALNGCRDLGAQCGGVFTYECGGLMTYRNQKDRFYVCKAGTIDYHGWPWGVVCVYMPLNPTGLFSSIKSGYR